MTDPFAYPSVDGGTVTAPPATPPDVGPVNGNQRPVVTAIAASPLSGPAPAPVAPPAPSRPVGAPPPMRFGLCGASGGGKTTYLTALSIGVQAANGPLGDWAMVAADDISKDFLVDGREQLITNRTFPPATLTAGSLSWQVYGDRGRIERPRRLSRLRRPNLISFTLDVDDLPGDAFLLKHSQNPLSEASLDRLVNAHALIFLFDPVRELNRGPNDRSNWVYFHNLLETIKMRLAQRGELIKGRLPQHVVMCVTKFDEPSIFQRAYEQRMIDIDDDGLPRVPNDRADEFFRWVCSWIDRDRGDGSSAQLRAHVEGSFVADRVHYFATSSIGFWTAPGGEFDFADYQNVEIIGGAPRIRGEIRPVNVLEPLIDLEHRIRTEGRR